MHNQEKASSRQVLGYSKVNLELQISRFGSYLSCLAKHVQPFCCVDLENYG